MNVTTERAEGLVEAQVGGVVVAVSDSALRLQEAGVIDRFYFRAEDVRMELLVPSESSTTCKLKGLASYWSVVIDGDRYEDVVWSYERPIEGREDIAGLLAFWDGKPGVTVRHTHVKTPTPATES